MNFSSLDTTIKRQIKSSMKLCINKILMNNSSNLKKVDTELLFKNWTNRFIFIDNSIRYYNQIQVDDDLFNEFRNVMIDIYKRESNKIDINLSKKKSNSHAKNKISNMQATEKQINYVNYLMNMAQNKSLPQKKYTKSDINIIINDLKFKYEI